jgi:hypothetical protein
MDRGAAPAARTEDENEKNRKLIHFYSESVINASE